MHWLAGFVLAARILRSSRASLRWERLQFQAWDQCPEVGWARYFSVVYPWLSASKLFHQIVPDFVSLLDSPDSYRRPVLFHRSLLLAKVEHELGALRKNFRERKLRYIRNIRCPNQPIQKQLNR